MNRTFYTYGSAISVTNDPQKLFTVLWYRTVDYCEVYSFETSEEAHTYALQRNCYYGYGWGAKGPMKLPLSGEYFLQNPDLGMTLPMIAEYNKYEKTALYTVPSSLGNSLHQQRTELWAVDFMNGFAVLDDLNVLVNILEDEKYLYVHAQWSSDCIERVLERARNNYIRRFYMRYDAKIEQLILPKDPKTTLFIDPYFQEREERYNQNKVMRILHSYGVF